MSMLKKYKVSLFGESYVLVSDESEEHIAATVTYVDATMRQVAEKSGVSDAKRIAVLTAVQCVSQFKNLEQQVHHYQQQEQKLLACLDTVLSS